MKYEFKENAVVLIPGQADEKKTIGDLLDTYLQSKKNRAFLLGSESILLDDIPVRSEEELIGTRCITLKLAKEEPDWIPADEPCQVVYSDPFLLVVHKPAGCIIHGEPDDKECLNAQVAKYMLDHDIHSYVRPVHRLDRDTQGLVIYSRISFFQPWFDDQLARKMIRRHYRAICFGKAENGQKMTIKAKLGRDRHINGAYRVSDTGKDAETYAEVLAVRRPYVLFGCRLETGRTHQIRVHLSWKGYPIVNDPLYGKRSKDFKGMGLWADEIEFRSPVTRKKHRIHDYEAEDFMIFNQE